MPWSVQDYGCWYVSKKLIIFLFILKITLTLGDSGDEISDYYGYNTGSLIKFECPLDHPDWYSVANQCFKVGKYNGSIQTVNFDEALILCQDPENFFSIPIQLPNWYLSVDLAKLIYSEIDNSTNLLPSIQNSTLEVWTGFYFDMDASTSSNCFDIDNFNCSQYPPIKKVMTDGIVSLFTPLWAKTEPKIPNRILNGISYNVDYKNDDIYGWKVQNFNYYLPVICQTFACREGEFRCKDNTKCIPMKAFCNSVSDCGDHSDEPPTCSQSPSSTVYTEKFGVIFSPAAKCFNEPRQFCEWQISQPPGAVIRLNFLDLKMLPEDKLYVEGHVTGETLEVKTTGPYTHLFADHELKVIYKPSLAFSTHEKSTRSVRGFQLQYTTEEEISCVSKYESWNGIIFTPTQLYNNGKYRSGMDCRWVVSKKGSTLLGVQIPIFDIAIGDYMKIYETEIDETNATLIGTFGNGAPPPTAMATHLSTMIFEFHSAKDSPGGRGIMLRFQQTCLNIYLNESHGKIESPGYRNPDYRDPFHCSWIIEVPCEQEVCGITFYFDALNLTNKDLITIDSNFETIAIDSTSLPILSHRTKHQKAILQMRSTSKYFAAQISYSIDCSVPVFNDQVIAKFETIPYVYRSSVDYSCASAPHVIIKKASCEKGGKWDILPPSCLSKNCDFKSIPNGVIVNTTNDGLEMHYQCRTGYFPVDGPNSKCIDGEWTPSIECRAITCGEPKIEYLNVNETGAEIPAKRQNFSGTNFTSLAHYGCEIGTIRGESAIRICQENGEWTTPIMYCKLPVCLNLEILNGWIKPLYAIAGQNVTVHCIDGYELNETQSSELVCGNDGHWIGDIPACYLQDQCTNKNCGNGQCKRVDDANTFTCKCAPGYRQETPSGPCVDIDECNMGFSFCGAQSTCKNTIGSYTCTSPGGDYFTVYDTFQDRRFPPETIKTTIFPQISTVRKRCPLLSFMDADWYPKDSFYLVTDKKVSVYCNKTRVIYQMECVESSEWKGDVGCQVGAFAPTCSLPVGLLAFSQNQSITGSVELGTEVTFTCPNPNQLLIGPAVSTCTIIDSNNTAAFTGTPICQDLQCSALIDNPAENYFFVQDTPTKYTKGSRWNLTCFSGFELHCPSLSNPDCAVFTCQDNLTWTSSGRPSCYLIPLQHCNINETEDITTSKSTYQAGEKIDFECKQPNYALSDLSDIYCHVEGKPITEAAQLRNDMINRNFWNQNRRHIRQAETFNLRQARPYKESIFDSQGALKGWDKSDNWIYSDEGWKFSPNFPGENNHLISPIIRVQLETGTIDITAENMSHGCVVEVSYFTANYLISEIPENKFQAIMLLNTSMPSQKASIKIVYSLLWIMVKAKFCDSLNLKHFEIARISCPVLHAGLTFYPSTATLPTDIVVRGRCIDQASYNGNSPQLICSSNGTWQLPIERYNPSKCSCNPGYTQQSQSCVKKGPVCYSCPYDLTHKCTENVVIQCELGEACMARIQKHEQGTFIEKTCSASCITSFHDIEQCRSGNETCTLCCGADFCNAEPKIKRELQRRNLLEVTVPTCLDMQPMELKCQPTITIKQLKPLFTEAVQVPWPEVIDNHPDVHITSNLLLNAEKYVFSGQEREIQWTGIDKHGKATHCTTNIVYEDYEKPQLRCPDMHVDYRSGTASKYVTISLPEIKATDASSVHVIYSPSNDTVVEIDNPILVNVTAIDAAGNLDHCQFWYMAVASDCPLWKIDTTQFICTQSENITVCHRRKPCVTRELPLDFKAIVCIPGQGWRFVQDSTPVNRISDTQEMIRTPYCLEQESSNITLSITFRTQSVEPTCAQIFVSATQIEMNNFVNRHCPQAGWTYWTKEIGPSHITFNFTTINPNTESVLACISEITSSLTRELPQAKIECAPLIKSHTITYHVYCSNGWGANTNLKCEKCPPGYFSTAEICVPCPLGTYSGNFGARECLSCEAGKSTFTEGAIDQTECVPFCGPGFFSHNGLAPCQTCPKGFYQTRGGAESCEQCPFNTTTIKTGSALVQDCQAICSPGHYSLGIGGAEPCSSCPQGYYQNNFGAEWCKKCPNEAITYGVGASSQQQCIEYNCQYIGCKNSGRCVNGKCQCKMGFVGYDCSVALDLCNAAYCLNDGLCHFAQNSTSCICKEGFTGTRCDMNLHRVVDTIPYDTTTMNPTTSFYVPSGNTCFSSFDLCINGKCINDSHSISCECNDGFIYNGTTCVEKNPCDFQPCLRGSCSSKSSNNFSCDCPELAKGRNCAISGSCVTDRDCNFGICHQYVNNGVLDSVCFCDPGYTGAVCNQSLNPCNSPSIPLTCQNCKGNGTDFWCQCDEDHVGEFCETQRNPCYSVESEYYCFNGGTCETVNSSKVKCSCPEGWTGDRCEEVADACESKYCQNNSTCINLFENKFCQCEAGYYGNNCQYFQDPCSNIPENDGLACGHGSCSSYFSSITGTLSFSCDCDNNWSNTDSEACIIPKTNCDPTTDCGNGVCFYNFEIDQETCICHEGYTGGACDEPIDYCQAENICGIGECRNQTNGFLCECDGNLLPTSCRLDDPCSGVNCSGFGNCIVKDGKPVCICVINHYGDNCEKNTSFCDNDKICGDHGDCKNTDDGGYQCECHDGYYGLYCSQFNDGKFNLYFTGKYGRQTIKTVKPVDSSSITTDNKGFTLCSWVRVGDNYAIETRAQAYSRAASNNLPFLQIIRDDTQESLISITSTTISVNGVNKTYPSPQNWYYLCLQKPDNKDYHWIIYVNAEPYSFDQNVTLKSFSSQISIMLAPPSLEGNVFQGELSLVELYDSAINFEDISAATFNCRNFNASQKPYNTLVRWKDFVNVNKNNTEVMVIRPGICYTYSCLPDSLQCNSGQDNTPPQITEHCPHGSVVIKDAPSRWLQYSFDRDVYDMFIDESPIVSITPNFRSGQSFSWGQYRIIITAIDLYANTASCEFTLIIKPANGTGVNNPDQSQTIFEPVDNYNNTQVRSIGSIKCVNEDYVVAKDYATFYVCDVFGEWYRSANAIQSDFNVPQCVKSVEGNQTLNGIVSMSGSATTCEDLTKLVMQTIQAADACKNGCAITVKNKCERREKRDTDMNVEFTVATDKTKLSLKEDVTKALTAINGIKTQIQNFSLDCLNKTTYPVEVTHSDVASCAMVPMGNYWSSNQLYECPKNTYKDFNGNDCSNRDECCIPCPEGTVTALSGSLSKSDCYKNCTPGEYYDKISDSCVICSKDTYQAYSGKRYCDQCPEYTSTEKLGSTQASDCHKCPPGKEIGTDGSCIDCPQGSYRNASFDSCVNCDHGLTTNGEGKTKASDCNIPYCPKGSQLRDVNIKNPPTIFADNMCQYCAKGYYQDQYNQSACVPCGLHDTTTMSNSSKWDDCVSVVNSTCNPIGEDDCGPYSMTCVCEYPFKNNPSVKKCTCQLNVKEVPPESQLWWISLLVAFFILALVITIVFIVWRKQVISCCCSVLRPPAWLESCLPENFKIHMARMEPEFRRSRHPSMESIPDTNRNGDIKESESISLPRLPPVHTPKFDTMAVPISEEREEETAFNGDDNALAEIRSGLRDMGSDAESVSPDPPRRLASPAAVDLRVRTSQHTQENKKNFEHVHKENGQSIKATSYSKQDTKNLSISLSQNVNSDKEWVNGQPVMTWLRDRFMQGSQDSPHSPSEQRTEFTSLSSPDWPRFSHSRDDSTSSGNSEALNHTSPLNQYKAFDSSKEQTNAQYFNNFTRSATSSAHQTGSFYSRNTRVRPNVDDDPDAFFS